MIFLSSALKHIVFPTLSRSGYLRRTAGDAPAVVTYHGVFPSGYEISNAALDGNLVHADSFRQQLKLLKKHYHLVAPEEFLRWSEGDLPLPPRSILLTCDDALRNTLTEMVPILKEFGLSCLFFATGKSADDAPAMLWYEELYLMLLRAGESAVLSLPGVCINSGAITSTQRHASWWELVEQLSRFDGEQRRRLLDQIKGQLQLPENWREEFIQDAKQASRFLMLDRTGLRELAAAGMTIGAHSLSHPILARASEGLARREIFESRSVLEKALGQPVWAFGYPFGNAATVTKRDLRLAEDAGFRCAFMNVGGRLDGNLNRFAIPRVHVTADMSLSEFEAHITGFYSSLRSRFMGAPEPGTAVGGER